MIWGVITSAVMLIAIAAIFAAAMYAHEKQRKVDESKSDKH